jgi:tetratricopeptide (TPR) repeat protein
MKIALKILFLAMFCLCLSACQSAHKIQSKYITNKHAPVSVDKKFKGYKRIAIETEREIFALNDEMKQMAKNISLLRDPQTKAKKLITQFFGAENINLAYKSGANVIASQAFRNKEANCLSLTIMAYAIAKEAQLDVVFQSIEVPEYWVRNGEANMLTGHINLSVLQNKSPNTLLFFDRQSIEIDFDPYVKKKVFPKKRINKNTVIAMFYNNKGANALVNNNYVAAYAYLKKATEVDPGFSSAWGNLGILYRMKGLDKIALSTYRHAIYLNQANLTAMENLSKLLHSRGASEEARLIDSHIIQKRANNPYYYALLGDENFHKGYYLQAINHYKKAIKLNNNVHEFYFGLAKVHYMLDDKIKAQQYIKKAIAKNKVPQLDNQYLVKLNILKRVH